MAAWLERAVAWRAGGGAGPVTVAGALPCELHYSAGDGRGPGGSRSGSVPAVPPPRGVRARTSVVSAAAGLDGEQGVA